MLRSFPAGQPVRTLSEIAAETGLARPTVRRILLTLEELGYVRAADRGYALTPRVLELGMAYVNSLSMWDVARPHMERLVAADQRVDLDGPARRRRHRLRGPGGGAEDRDPGGHRSAPASRRRHLDGQGAAGRPADPTSSTAVLAEPSRSGITPRWQPARDELDRELREVRAKGWALADQDLAPGIRSVATGVRDGDGTVVAAINVTVHAAETSRGTADRGIPARCCCAAPPTSATTGPCWARSPWW